MDEENAVEKILDTMTSGALSWLFKILPLEPFKEQVGELFGDIARGWRFSNIARVMNKVDEKARKLGFDSSEAKALVTYVGLPLIEKASYCDDDLLQEKWAELFLSVVTGSPDRYSMGTTYMHILEQLDPWDCAVLDHLVTIGGVSKSYFREVEYWHEIDAALSPPGGEKSRTLLAIEKLVRCGCIEKTDVHASRPSNAVDMYGGVARYVSLTVTGLKFHIAVTGDEPAWLQNEDELREDINPITSTE